MISIERVLRPTLCTLLCSILSPWFQTPFYLLCNLNITVNGFFQTSLQLWLLEELAFTFCTNSLYLKTKISTFINNSGVVMLWIRLTKRRKTPTLKMGSRSTTSALKNQMLALSTSITQIGTINGPLRRRRNQARRQRLITGIQVRALKQVRLFFKICKINYLSTSI